MSDTFEHETVRSIHCSEVEPAVRRFSSRCIQCSQIRHSAKQHITLTGFIPIPCMLRSTDQQVVETIAVDVSCIAHGIAGIAQASHTAQHEAVRTVQCREIDATVRCPSTSRIQRRQVGLPAEHQVALTGISPARVGVYTTDQQIGKSVAVDIPRPAHRNARVVTLSHAIEHEAGRSVQLRETDPSICRSVGRIE